MATILDEVKLRIRRCVREPDVSEMPYPVWLENKLLEQVGYVADLQRQMKARIESGELPDPLLLTTIGGMAKNLLMTEQL
jgi:hypothetical protein